MHALPALITSENSDLADVLTLIQDSFAYMEGRIDPPSSIHQFDLATIQRHAAKGEMVVIGDPPAAAMVMQTKPATLYLGKIAVAKEWRGTGLARRLIAFAEETARTKGLATLTLQSRVELTENHSAFRALGFAETGRTAHNGYQNPTSITFTKAV